VTITPEAMVGSHPHRAGAQDLEQPPGFVENGRTILLKAWCPTVEVKLRTVAFLRDRLHLPVRTTGPIVAREGFLEVFTVGLQGGEVTVFMTSHLSESPSPRVTTPSTVILSLPMPSRVRPRTPSSVL